VTLPGHACPTSAYKKVQIGASISLQHMVVVELIIAPPKRWLGWLILLAAALDLRVIDIQMKSTCSHVQFDHISPPNQP
jgi:hypothetical protein